jgi:carboxypeptidase PM20D1
VAGAGRGRAGARGSAARAALLAACLAPAAAAAGPAERLAEAIRFRTVTGQDADAFDPAPFRALHAFLAASYPRVHAALERHVIGDASLLFVWPGREPAARPILLTAHLDVVPVPAGQEAQWQHAPFAGVVADGFVWGRGALDDKAGVIGTLEAVEALLGRGFRPRRTVYLAFGHDEERGGDAGAGAITEWLAARGVRLLFTLDEGMAIT